MSLSNTLSKSVDVAEAISLPGYVYTSDKIYERELEQIFYSSWLMVGHVNKLREIGDVIIREVGEKSVIVVRSGTSEFSAFYNVCRHRGARIMMKRERNTRVIQCPYHGWTYGLDGRLIACPEMEETREFNKDDFPLYRIHLQIWGGFIFVNLSENPAPLSLEFYLGDFIERFSKYGMEKLHWVGIIGEYDIACNWKVYTENFNECYHCSIVHPETLGEYARNHIPTDPKEIHGSYSMYYYDDRPTGKGTVSGNLGSLSKHLEGSSNPTNLTEDELHRVFLPTLFPNTSMAIAPNYVVVYQAWPDGLRRSKVQLEFLATTHSGPEEWKDTMETLDFINKQDKVIAETTQLGLNSNVFQGGRFSTWERSVHHFQRLYADSMGLA